jgi:Tfp pilus assembly protein PilF
LPALGQVASSPPQPSLWQSFKQSVSPKPAPPTVPEDDPTSLRNKAKPGIDLYVAVARLYEESGRFAEAEAQYKRALQEAPKDLRPLLGYARLKDRLGEAQEALRLYQQAVQANPREPAASNDLAMHFARHNMLREAIGTEERAIQLRPAEPRYRNNMAMFLVDAGRPQEAYFHLHAVYDEALAHYNLGYLLKRAGQAQAAAEEFTAALRLNPSLAPAQQWLNRMAAGAKPSGEPGRYGPPPDEPRVAIDPRVRPMAMPGGEPPAGAPPPPIGPPLPANMILAAPGPPQPPPRMVLPAPAPPDVPAARLPATGAGELQRLPPTESEDPPPYMPRTQ